MGGDGSGRHKDPVKKYAEQRTPIATSPDIIMPNYSGVQEAALKTSAPLSTGGGGGGGVTDHALLTNLDYASASHTGFQATIPFDDLSGSYNTHADDATIHYVDPGFLTAETDPIFGALSGSLPYASDTLLSSLSGSHFTHAADDSIHFTSGSIWAELTDLNGDLSTHTTDTTIHYTSGSIWSNIDGLSGSTLYNKTQNTSLSGSAFTHINDNTQAHSDYLLNNASDSSSGMITAAHYNTAGTISGANIFNTGDHNTSGSAFVVGVIMDTSATPPTASNFPQGTIYLQYTA